MNHKNFYAVFMIIFALVSIGGCGGGGSNNFVDDISPDIPEFHNAETYIINDEMQNVSEDAMLKLYDELVADGTFDKLNARGYHVAFIDEDFAGTDMSSPELVPAENALELFSNDLRGEYNKGAVIAMLSPNEEAINILLEALGEDANFIMPGSADKLELYAVARVTDQSGKTNLFTYNIPSRKNFVYSDSEIETISAPEDSRDIQSGDSSINPDDIEEYTGTTSEDIERIQTNFHVERWRDFYKWAAYEIDELAERAIESKAKLSAITQDEFSSLASCYNQVIPFNYCQTFKPFSNNGGRYDRTISRKTRILYHVYSCHSFSSGSDYYLIRATLTTEPDFHFDNIQRNYDKGESVYTQYNAGFTNYVINSAYIDGVKDDDSSKILLLASVPGDSVPKNTTRTTSMGWSEGGSIGFSLASKTGAGINATMTQSVSHNESTSYTTQNWTLQNLCSISNPKFKALFDTEYNNGDQDHHYHWYGDYDIWQDLRVNNETKSRLDFTTEWVWEVKKDFWQNSADGSVKIICNTIIGERFAYGWGRIRPGNPFAFDVEVDGQSKTIEVQCPEGTILAPTPAHIYVNQRNFNAKPEGETISVNLLCNSDWTITSDSDWCKVATTSGTDTGGIEKQILFNVSAHPQAGSANFEVRTAHITAQEVRPGNKMGDKIQLEIQQANK